MASTSSTSGLGVIPKVRFTSSQTCDENPEMAGFPPEDFSLEREVEEIKQYDEFQVAQRNIQALLTPATTDQQEDNHSTLPYNRPEKI